MATIVYRGTEDAVSEDVADEDLNYREQHWQIHHGDDVFTYVPRERVITVRMTDPHALPE